ncbi:hypothetical protein [Phenylobacterium immobile]|uniref:hypothetical protein n=1 Tax=Phenylobacterium immobile TaxID=21 RepID=UPI000B18C0FF|nr:hypothetical protein [Phenylobacterium immobile]
MRIAWKPRVADPAIASFRYRVLLVIEALAKRGHAVELWDEANLDTYDVVVFGKSYRAQDQALAMSLRAQGKRVLLDLCDNHFYNPYGLPAYEALRVDLLGMIAACDGVICSTPALAREVRQAAQLDALPHVVGDMFEDLAPLPPSTEAGSPRLLWFGMHGSPNAPSGMTDLLRVAEPLRRAYERHPFELVVLSNNRAKFDEHIAPLPFPTRYVEWSSDVLAQTLSDARAVLIPLSDNPFVACKTHNRLTLALAAGKPVIADTIEAYQAFAPYAVLSDWDAGLTEVLGPGVEDARRRTAAGRAYIETHWSVETVAGQWAAILGLAAPTPGDPVAQPTNTRPPEALVEAMMGAATPQPAGSDRGGNTPQLIDWIGAESRNTQPWLILGEPAPEQHLRDAIALDFCVMTIGAAISRRSADVALVVDLETLDRHGDAILSKARTVAMPNQPHVRGWATGRTLASLAADHPVLRRLVLEGRLLGFDLWTAHGASPSAPLDDFENDELPLRLLAEAGVKMARRSGVAPRSSGVAGFEAMHPVREQAGGAIAAIRRRYGISYGPFGYPVPARIFIGADDEQLLGAKVLQHSIDRYSSMDVEFEILDWRAMPVPAEPKNRSKTGFSFCRFDIPRLCGYAGRGVYVDADMQVFTDIADLWTMPMEEADLLYALSPPAQGRAPQTSVMLINCETLKWDVADIIRGLDEERYTYKELMGDLCIVPAGRSKALLPYWWNSLEFYEPGRTALIHYTDMRRQPWVSQANPNGHLWYDGCRAAIAAGVIKKSEVVDAIEQGHVAPKLFSWIGVRGPPVNRPDEVWIAPFNRFLDPKKPEGQVSAETGDTLVGWAWDPQRPDEPIGVQIFAGDDLVATLECSDYSRYLQQYGKGDGRHGFRFVLPEAARRARNVTVRTADRKIELGGSPVSIR